MALARNSCTNENMSLGPKGQRLVGRKIMGCFVDLRRGPPTGVGGGRGRGLGPNGGNGSRKKGEGMQRKEKQPGFGGAVA